MSIITSKKSEGMNLYSIIRWPFLNHGKEIFQFYPYYMKQLI